MSMKMRERFASFQRKTTADLDNLWSIAEFTFDANVLLNLYNSPRLVLNQFSEYLVVMGTRFYLTDQVVLEFYRNREKVFRQALNAADVINELIDSLPAAFSETAQQELTKLLKAEKDNLEKFLSVGDAVEKTISDAVAERIDPPFEDVVALFAEIDKRYAAQIPPGFADLGEKDDYKKYGDAVLWLQTVAHQKRTKKPLILVTSDDKYDWWVKNHENKIVGPRPELAHEMWEKAQVHFHLYSFKQFLKFAAKQWPQGKGGKNGEEAVRVVEKMEQEREVATQIRADSDNLQAQLLASEQGVLHDWVMNQPPSVLDTRSTIEALTTNSLQTDLALERVRRMQQGTNDSTSLLEKVRRMQEDSRRHTSFLEQVRRIKQNSRRPTSFLEQVRRMQEEERLPTSVLEQVRRMQEEERLPTSALAQARRMQEETEDLVAAQKTEIAQPSPSPSKQSNKATKQQKGTKPSDKQKKQFRST
jgi:hypothetical protein